MVLYMSSKLLADKFQLKASIRSRPFSIRSLRNNSFPIDKRNALVISARFDGLTSRAASPATSGNAEVLDVITGVPQAMDSSTGMPKLSRNDGYKNTLAPA